MKQNLKDDILSRKSSGVFALVAILALGISAAAYDEVHRDVNAGERDMAMIDRLNEAAHLHVMLGQLGSGHIDEVRTQLKAKLAGDLAVLNPLVASASTQAGSYARCLLAQLDRDQKARPDYYLTLATPAGLNKLKVVQLGGQVAVAKPVSQ